MSNFASALEQHLNSLPYLGLWERRALRIVADKDTPRNAKLIERWEKKSRASLGFDPSSIIDWLKANWKTILQVVLAVLGLLLMFAEPEMDASPEAVMAAEEAQADWFPGRNIIEQFLPEIIRSYGIPTLRAAMPGLPATDDEWVAYAMEKYKAGQQA